MHKTVKASFAKKAEIYLRPKHLYNAMAGGLYFFIEILIINLADLSLLGVAPACIGLSLAMLLDTRYYFKDKTQKHTDRTRQLQIFLVLNTLLSIYELINYTN